MMEQQREATSAQSGETPTSPASEQGGIADAAYLANLAARSASAHQSPNMVVRDGIMGA